MQAVKTIGLDIAKSVFQVHGVDAEGQVAIRRKLKRRYVLAFFEKLPPCLIGMEACATSHHWSRELQALGHRVRLYSLGVLGVAADNAMSAIGPKQTSLGIAHVRFRG
jgi:transposase